MPSQMWRWGTSSTAPTRKRARPWLLLSAPLMALTGILLFTVPNGSETVQAVWVMVSYNLFYSFAYTIFNMSHSLMVPLSTRDTGQRGGLSVFNQITTIMMSGILVALIFLRVIMPAIGVDKGRWITLMSILSVLALPLTLLEYYFTKERVTEEVENAGTESVAFARQLGAIFSDRYMILIYAYFLISAVGACIKNISLVYFCNCVLGSYNDGITQTMISVIGGIPMGIGIFAVWPLAKRFGKRNVTIAGCILITIGSGICCMFPTDMTMMLVGQFVKNRGSLPGFYVFMALRQMASYRQAHRPARRRQEIPVQCRTGLRRVGGAGERASHDLEGLCRSPPGGGHGLHCPCDGLHGRNRDGPGQFRESRGLPPICHGCRRSYQALRKTPAYSLDTDRQAQLVRPLAFGLLDQEQTAFAEKRLLTALEHFGWCIGTGFLSTPLILDVLADIDIEAAYRLLESEEMPGWLFMPKNGATTVGEAWEGTATEKVGIASLNHYSKGAVCRWLFDTMCGIRVEGEKHFVITPRPGGHFTYAKAGYNSVYGKVESGWARTEEGWKFDITITANCTAAEVVQLYIEAPREELCCPPREPESQNRPRQESESQNCSSREPESQNCSSREPESQNCPSREPEALHRPLRELKGFRNMYKAVEATIAKGFGGKADYENPEFRMMMASSAGSPLRSMQISGGMKGGLLPGMLEIANGHFFRGLWKMIKG